MTDEQRIIEYLQETVREQQEIIRQLSGEKLAVTYIHPYDLMEVMQDADVFKMLGIREGGLLGNIDIQIGDTIYRRSGSIPARTKAIA